MGEAKRRTIKEAELMRGSSPMKRARFDLFALGARRSMAHLVAEELSWWSDPDESAIGFIFRDRVDDDFGWILMARDRAGRFRSVDLETSLADPVFAERRLRVRLASVQSENPLEFGLQADEPNEPVDLLRLAADQDRRKLHPYFLELLERPGRAPARAVVREIGPWLAPADMHLIKEFQENQFDQRLWEIFLWAAFREIGFDVEQLIAPDFRCRAPGIDFTVEATTAAPSTMGPLATHPDPQTQEEMRDFLENYMPMKYGSSLTTKLAKVNAAHEHYWEREQSRDKPFILAIADFHKPAGRDELGSMTYTHSALWRYLYGLRVDWEFLDNKLVLKPTKGLDHKYGGKAVPSGFFDQPEAENVSAVLFSNAGTIAKFDRMGIVAGFEAANHKCMRMGLRYNPDPNAVSGIPFAAEVSSDNYEEYWSDELQVFHNPNAKHPVPEEWFAGLTQHFFRDGDLHSFTPDGAILSSYTMMLEIVPKGGKLGGK